MSNVLQTLFNTNHEQPSFLVFLILAVIAFVVPAVAKYLRESRQSGSTATSARSPSDPGQPAPAGLPPPEWARGSRSPLHAQRAAAGRTDSVL